jgi:hypothetical protein
MYPRIADAVGVAILAASSADPTRRVFGRMVQDAMSAVVLDHYASDRPRDPVKIKADMLSERADIWRRAISKVTVGWG